MADCSYVMQDGDRCRNWTALSAVHCDFHTIRLSMAVEAYYKIVRWCEKKYGGGT